MSRKWRGGSSPSRRCATDPDRSRARRSWSGTSGRTGGSPAAAAGSRASMMNLWASKPHAPAGAATASARQRSTSTTMPALSHARLTIPVAISLPQRPQVARVPGIDVAPPPALGRVELRRLEQHRQPREPRIVQQPPERLEPEASLADVLVPIDAAAARLLRVVQVEHLDPVEADDAIELVERRVVALVGADVVAGGQQVAGIEADADARRAVEPLEDRRRGARSGGRGWCPARRCARAGSSAPRADARASSVRERLGDQPQPVAPRCRSCTSPGCMTSPSRPSASARSSSSPSAAIDCARSAGARGGDVDQIAVVRDDRLDAGLGDAPAEQRDLVGRQRPRPPLPRRLGEDLQRLAPRRHGAIDGARQAAGDRQMGAEPRHQLVAERPRPRTR